MTTPTTRTSPATSTDRVALVTGASSGIGLALARKWIQRGGRVALVARSADRLDALVRELGPDRAASFPLDVRDRPALLSLPQKVVDRFGRLDVVVHNAGMNHRGALLERSIDELASVLEANLVAPVLLTRAALPFLKEGAAVVNIASLAGKVPVPHEAAYSASKAGLRAFGRALEAELRGARITVSTVCPGPVDTGFLADTEHVPDLVFSQPMSSAERVADETLRAIDGGLKEVDVPRLSGILATLGYLYPSLFVALRPLLEMRGARNKRRYIARSRSGTSS
jgi:short-subunit dehydrogenase